MSASPLSLKLCARSFSLATELSFFHQLSFQDYDPDLPPELAAATGQDVPTDAVNLGKSDGGQHDLPKGAARVRPPIVCFRCQFYYSIHIFGLFAQFVD